MSKLIVDSMAEVVNTPLRSRMGTATVTMAYFVRSFVPKFLLYRIRPGFTLPTPISEADDKRALEYFLQRRFMPSFVDPLLSENRPVNDFTNSDAYMHWVRSRQPMDCALTDFDDFITVGDIFLRRWAMRRQREISILKGGSVAGLLLAIVLWLALCGVGIWSAWTGNLNGLVVLFLATLLTMIACSSAVVVYTNTR
jgi:hypothetical protein